MTFDRALQNVLRGAAWNSFGSVSGLLISFVTFVVLARILGPTEFGYVAVATIFIDATLVLARAGMHDAIVQREELDERTADTAFWLSLATAGASFLALVLLAPALARFFAMPVLEPMLQVLAFAVPLGALGSIHEARIVRGFGFRRLALRMLAANALGGVVAIAAAFHGWGIWSLVAQRLVAAALLTVLACLAYPWCPRFRFDGREGRQLLAFGGKILGSNLLMIANGRVHEVIAALFLSPAAVGYLRVAWRCLDLMMQVAVNPLVTLALPTISRLRQQPTLVGAAYLRFVGGAALIAFPCFLGFAAVAPSLIPLAFGEAWRPAVPLAQILAILVVPAIPSAFAWPTLNALDRAGATLVVTALQVAAGAGLSFVAAPFGVAIMALSHVVRALLLWPVALEVLCRTITLAKSRVVTVLLRPLAGATLMAVLVALAHATLFASLIPVAAVLASVVLGLAIYAALIWLIAGDQCRELVALARGRAAFAAKTDSE